MLAVRGGLHAVYDELAEALVDRPVAVAVHVGALFFGLGWLDSGGRRRRDEEVLEFSQLCLQSSALSGAQRVYKACARRSVRISLPFVKVQPTSHTISSAGLNVIRE